MRTPSKRTVREETVERALVRLRGVLQERSLRFSRVREAIVRAALSYPGHFSVEDLLRQLQAEGVREAHLATLYRAMPLLVQAGLIELAPVSGAEGQRYEAAFEREHHDHLVCTQCGHIVEYQSEAMEALQRDIAARYGFELDDHLHVLRGRCKSCRKTQARPNGARLPQ